MTTNRLPRLSAAASLKRSGRRQRGGACGRSSAALRRGLIEASSHPQARHQAHRGSSAALRRGLIEAPTENVPRRGVGGGRSSAALRRGLIEARRAARYRRSSDRCLPRLSAAASLKHRLVGWTPDPVKIKSSAALRRGLIEASSGPCMTGRAMRRSSAALRRGLIEAASASSATPSRSGSSAALRRGLIEARSRSRPTAPRTTGLPRLSAAASLKHAKGCPDKHESPRLPRLSAAASLKPAIRARCPRSSDWSSAALRRGLIEAPETPRPLRRSRSVFRGSPPRPH